MNKDLEGFSAIWRALFGALGCHFCRFIWPLVVHLSSTFQRAAENSFAADDGPSLETGAVFDAALSGNYCAIAIWCL
jgi:hypothetical protein